MTAPRKPDMVDVVAFGDEIHVYPAGLSAAQILYTTAIGSNLDAELVTITATRWDATISSISPYEIHDHRSPAVAVSS